MRAAAELTGCSHHTVARHIAARDAGQPIAEPDYRGRATHAFLPKIEEWIEASKDKIRADKAALRGWWGIEFVSLKTRGPVALLGECV